MLRKVDLNTKYDGLIHTELGFTILEYDRMSLKDCMDSMWKQIFTKQVGKSNTYHQLEQFVAEYIKWVYYEVRTMGNSLRNYIPFAILSEWVQQKDSGSQQPYWMCFASISSHIQN